VAGRPVAVKTYVEGGYRVSTTQGADHSGSISVDDTSTMIMAPSSKGRKINIDGESIEEVREQLAIEGFSDDEATQITEHFPA
jgi:hypothetical protein